MDASGPLGDIDLKDVRAFCAVVDARSVTAAAKLLGETKGSVSRRVARLERALGVALLRRSPRLVQPTDDGVVYRTKMGRALELFEEAAHAVQDAQEQPKGRLRITAPADFANAFLPSLVARFTERFPSVQVEMVASDLRLDFDAQQLDCAFRVGALEESSLRVHKVLDIQMGLFASPAYLAARGTPKKPRELEGHRFLAYTQMPRPMELTFEDKGQRYVVGLEAIVLGDGAFVHNVARQGGGIAAIPAVLAASDVEAGVLVPVLHHALAPLSRPLSLLYPATTLLPAKMRVFRDFVLESLARPAIVGRSARKQRR